MRTQPVSDADIQRIVARLVHILNQEVCVVVYDAGNDDPHTPHRTYGTPLSTPVVRVWLAAGHYTLLVPNEEFASRQQVNDDRQQTAQILRDAEFAKLLQNKEFAQHQQVQSDKDLAWRLRNEEDLLVSKVRSDRKFAGELNTGGGCAIM